MDLSVGSKSSSGSSSVDASSATATATAEVTNGSGGGGGTATSNKRKDPQPPSSPVQVDAEDLSVPRKKPATDDNKVVADDGGQGTVTAAAAAAEGTDAPVVIEGFEDLEGIEVVRVLSNSADYKRIVVEGKSKKSDKTAIVILDKKPFVEDSLAELFSKESKLAHTFQNDIYGSYDCAPAKKAAEIKTTIVYPATQKHIEKYAVHPIFLVDETPELYKNVTLPYLEESSFNIQWVYNILEHKKETDRIVFEDSDPQTGFVLLPDLKWDGETQENLYLVAIVFQRDLKSIRDLTQDHLPLLENIWVKGSEAIETKYGLKRSQLRVYFHYQPSYYHLHVHFTSLRFNAPGIYTEKSHLIQTVISNIKSKSTFYQEATLPFVVKENDKLYEKLNKNGYLF